MTHSDSIPVPALPALPAGIRLESLEVGGAPVIRHFLERLDLTGLFNQHLPSLRGRQRDVPTATVLGLLLTNFLLAREPLYALASWASGFVPQHLGLLPEQLPLLQDDRFGRALDHLYRADRASLLTAVVLRVVKVFSITLEELHQDTTTVTFTGDYLKQPPADKADRPARITRGYNKDHRPDLKQLLYNRTITSDGAVPIHCTIHDGNTSDTKVHKQTWQALCAIVGGPNFLYVADSKLCECETMSLIAEKEGRFLTVMPRTRAEYTRFLDGMQAKEVPWSPVAQKENPRGKEKPKVVYQGYEDIDGSAEGYRIIWYHSSQKQDRDKTTRLKKVNKTRKRLQRLRPAGRGERFETEAAARAAIERVLEKADANLRDWLTVTIEEVIQTKDVQVGRGRPGPNTTRKRVETKSYQVLVEDNAAGLKQAARWDGVFALMTNDKSLTVKGALGKYKYQPYAEKRHQQLKTVFEVRPVCLKNAKRVESFLCLYHLVEVVQALVEREVRREMEKAKTKQLALYPEGRRSAAPTTEMILKAFAGHRRHRLLDAQGVEIGRFHDPVSEVAQCILKLLCIDASAYGIA